MTRATASDNFNSAPQLFSLPDAELQFWPGFLEAEPAQQLLQTLMLELPWQQPSIQIYGRNVKIPRQQVWMGEAHCCYRYSGTTFQPQPWHPAVQQLAQQLSEQLALPFNCVLLNLYQGGGEHMGWHADDEPELGVAPKIASISLGQSRRFDLKHRHLDCQLQLALTHGSLLLMAGRCQQSWLHRLPKQAKATATRLNLTFRYIASPVS